MAAPAEAVAAHFAAPAELAIRVQPASAADTDVSPLVMAANATAPPQPRQPSSVPPANRGYAAPAPIRAMDLFWLALALLIIIGTRHRHPRSVAGG